MFSLQTLHVVMLVQLWFLVEQISYAFSAHLKLLIFDCFTSLESHTTVFHLVAESLLSARRNQMKNTILLYGLLAKTQRTKKDPAAIACVYKVSTKVASKTAIQRQLL